MASDAGRPDYDQALRRLLARAHDGFLALLLPGARWLGERDAVLPAIRREADLVWEVALGGERVLLHVELQTKLDPQIGERLAEYGLRLWRRDHLPVYSVVVYLRESLAIPDSPLVIGRGRGQEALLYYYEVVRLWREPPERALAAEPGLWPLAALMAGEPAETVATVAERIARAPLEPGERQELTGLLAALAGLRLPPGAAERLLRRNLMLREILEESTTIAVLRDEWRAKFEAQGRAEGKAEGKAEGQRALVRAMLEGRFGALAAEELAALGAAEEPALLALATHITTDSREQARTRLGLT